MRVFLLAVVFVISNPAFSDDLPDTSDGVTGKITQVTFQDQVTDCQVDKTDSTHYWVAFRKHAALYSIFLASPHPNESALLSKIQKAVESGAALQVTLNIKKMQIVEAVGP